MKSKKLLLFIFVLINTFIFNIKAVFALDISIKDIKVDSKGGSPTISDINYSGNNINSSIVFNDVNDYVKLKITLNNKDNEKYTINSIKNNNKIDNLEVSYSYDDKTIKAKGTKDIYVTLKYNKKVTNKNISLNDLTITLNLIDSKGNGKNVDINPTTGDNIKSFIILFIVSLIVLLFSILLIKRRKLRGFFILLLALVPTVVIAKEKLSVDIKLTNITIKGEFLPYTVSVKNANGNITERTIIYGQQVGQLPEVSKNGYTFDKYVDDDNNEVTSETIVTDDMTVTPKFTVIEYDITYAYNGGYALNKTKYTVEDEFTLNNPIRLGYTFAGWTGSNGEAKQTSVTISHETGDKNYVANWSSNPNTPYKVVHRYPNLDGTYREVVQNLSGPTGEQVTPGLLPEEGFTGPSQLTEITIEAVEDEANIPTVTYTYTRNQYRLTVLHPEYIQEGDKSDLYYYGQQVTLTAKSRDNYTFNKWSNDTTDNPLVLTITGTISIEALYKESGFNVTYNANGGNYYEANVTTNIVKYNTQKNIIDGTYKTPTKTDKAFKGWYTDSNCTDGNEFDIDSVTLTSDIEVYAKWETGIAMFNTGENINTRMFRLAGTPTYDADTNILSFTRSTTIPEEYRSSEYVVSTDDSDIPIYMWYEDDTKAIKWYSDVTKAYLNTDASKMFLWLTEITTLDLNGIDSSRTTNMTSLFHMLYKLETLDLTKLDTSNVTKMESMLSGLKSIRSLDFSNFNTSNVTDMNNMFNGSSGLTELNLSTFDTKKVTDMSYMFASCLNLERVNLSSFNTSSVRKMKSMFGQGILSSDTSMNKLTELDLSNFDTKNVTDMSSMFLKNSHLVRLNLNSFNTINVRNMKSMFSNCSSLTELNIHNFNTINTTNMEMMFQNCSSLTTIDLSGFDTRNVTSMESMFSYCSSLTSLDLSHFNTSKLTTMAGLFYDCSSLKELDLSSFDFSNITSLTYSTGFGTFQGCSNLEKIVVDKNMKFSDSFYNSDSIFIGCEKLVGGAGTSFDSNHTDIEYAHIDGGTSNPGYFTSNVIEYTVTFNPNGATVSTESVTVNSGENINTLPTPTNIPARKVFAGWYTGLNDGVKVTEPYTPTGDITLFARFEDMPFNYAFNHPGECTFNGSEGYLTGTNCEYADGVNKYIDTGVKLYDTTNHANDYEIGFNIVSYDPNEQVKQATFMNTKLEGNSYPGLVFRRYDNLTKHDLSSRNTSSANVRFYIDYTKVQSVKIYRIYNEEDDVQEIFYSINGQAKVRMNDLSQFNPIFDLNVWFGAAPTDANASDFQRVLKGTLSNMYIKVGKYHE